MFKFDCNFLIALAKLPIFLALRHEMNFEWKENSNMLLVQYWAFTV